MCQNPFLVNIPEPVDLRSLPGVPVEAVAESEKGHTPTWSPTSAKVESDPP